MPKDFDKYSAVSKISMSEICGRRGEKFDKNSKPKGQDAQQDAMFVGYVNNENAKNNPAEFLKKSIEKIEVEHKECGNGTTLCSAIVQKDGDDVKITIGNLGDSRTAVIVKYKDPKTNQIEYKSVLLTEDHDFQNQRVRSYIESKVNGAIEYENGVERVGGLNMGASIGDSSVIKKVNMKVDPLLRTPDIFEYKLSGLYQSLGINSDNVINVDMVVSCDGMWDLGSGKKGLQADYVTKIDLSGKPKIEKNNSVAYKLSEVKQKYDEESSKLMFAKEAVNYAYNNQSGDNISVANIPLIENKEIKIAEKPIMATVCDGHGEGKKEHYTTLDGNMIKSEKSDWDGYLVSSSVAVDLYKAAEISQIKDLEVESESIMNKFLQDRKVKIVIEDTIDTNSTKKNSTKTPKIKKENWFAEWNETENNLQIKSRQKGTAASKITTTESYLKYSKIPLIETKKQSDKDELIKKFPFTQEIQGDGFCVLHASIVGILAKSVGDKNKFDEFKKNLKEWGDENHLKQLQKSQLTQVLNKLNEKDNLTYQDFYELVNEEGKQNIVTSLSKILLRGTDFDNQEKRAKFDKYIKDHFQSEVNNSEWSFLKEQREKVEKGKNIDSLSDIGAMYMLNDISPFKIICVNHGNLSKVSNDNNSVYISHANNHFNLLHSSENKNLIKAVKRLESEKISIQDKENKNSGKTNNEKKDDRKNEEIIINQEVKQNTPKRIAKEDNSKDQNSKNVIFQNDNSENQTGENYSEPNISANSSTNYEKNLKPKLSNKKRVSFEDNKNLGDRENSSHEKYVDQKTNKQRIDEFVELSLKEVPSFENSSVFKNIERQESKIIDSLKDKYGFEADEKTKELINVEIDNRDKVFDNKLKAALNRLRLLPKDHLDKENDTEKVENSWKNLTTLDRRILVDYYNQNNAANKIDFMSLYKDAGNEKSELRVQSKDYVLDSAKVRDVAMILGFAATAIPSNSIQNPTVERLSHINFNTRS